MEHVESLLPRPLQHVRAVVVVREVHDAAQVEPLEEAEIALVRVPAAVHARRDHVKVQRGYHDLA